MRRRRTRAAGKRRKKQNRNRLPGVLMLLCAVAMVVSPVSPAGIAADSPAEQPPPPELVTAAAPAEPEFVPLTPYPAPEEIAEEPWMPVAESPAVEDTYFLDAAFLGDSRTEGFHLYSGLKEGSYFCAVGATVESVFTKKVWGPEENKIPLLDALAKEELCGKVYVMLGVNELGWAKTELFREQYAKVIARIREDHPEAQVVIQSILPVSAKQDAKKTYVNNVRIRAYNEIVVAMAEELDCAYVNVAEAVIDEDGCLRADLTSDGVHLNIKGCKIWLDYLKTHSI